jgi:hypothetical protein
VPQEVVEAVKVILVQVIEALVTGAEEDVECQLMMKTDTKLT